MGKTLIIWTCVLVFIIGIQPKTQIEEFSWVDHSTVALLEYFEGKRYKAYQDSEGNWTTGVGHLIKRQTRHLLHRELSEDEVMAILHQDLEKCSTALESALNVGINRAQINALLSLCHNIGPDNFVRSHVLKYVNQGEIQKAADAFLNWSNPQVLKKRREIERTLFLAGA